MVHYTQTYDKDVIKRQTIRSDNMKAAIVTMEVKTGQCVENVEYMKKMIEKAKQDHADIILFPQNAVSGYYNGDQWKDAAWCRYVEHFNKDIIAQSDDIAIVWGNIKYRGGKLFNCAFFAYQGNTYMRVRRKGKDAFSMDAYFQELDINSAIEFKDKVLALNFGTELQLADWNINIDAHPFDIHDEKQLRGNVIYVNAVGMQNVASSVMIMEGGSYVCKENAVLFQMPYGKAGYELIDLDCSLPCTPQKPVVCDILACGIRGFDQQILQGKLPWIIGLSGGLDSSVSAALLTYALGKERIIGYGMRTQHNSEATCHNAKQLAEALEIQYHDGTLQPLVDASKDVLKMYGYDTVEGLALENIQARLRGHLLSSFASLHGGVVVNNGNKVENALGYCTLYGDAIGALGILGDLTKVQLFSLAKELNSYFGREVVPENLLPVVENGQIHFDVPPTAELKSEQIDPMKWFYHDYLVDHLGRDLTVTQFLEQYIDGSLFQQEIGTYMKFYGLDNPKSFLDDLDWFLNTCKRNIFKHTQVPAILTVSKNGYALRKEVQAGFDTLYLQALRHAILEL